MLFADPIDELVELDCLLGGHQSFGSRKSVFDGGMSNADGGSGYAGHWRCAATAGIACGFGVALQPASASAGKAPFKSILRLLVDLGLLAEHPLGIGDVVAPGLLGRRAIGSQGLQMGNLPGIEIGRAHV